MGLRLLRNRSIVTMACKNNKSSFSATNTSDGQVSEFRKDQTQTIESLWREFFSDPSQWWDHRSDKVNSRYPDFKHKETQQGLWLDGKSNPHWVASELAAMIPGAIQLSMYSWNKRLENYVKTGKYEKTMLLFEKLQQKGMKPDQFTFVPVLSAVACLGVLEEGKRVHALIIQSGCDSDSYVSSSLVDMYAKCGSIEDARRVFDKMSMRNCVSWNVMILGHVKCGEGENAVELYHQMRQEGVEPDPVTLVGVFSACASIAALDVGRLIHEEIMQHGYDTDVFVDNSLIDMYAKCGSIDDARRVFEKMTTRDVVSWNAVLGGYSTHGYFKEALGIFDRMDQENVRMNEVTFVSLLSACSHAGLVDEGLEYFESMSSKYSLIASVEHLACKVDLLGRAGRLHEAEDLIKTMTSQKSATLWKSSLSSCRVHGNLEMGEQIANRLFKLVPDSDAGYVLLSNIYASAGKWDSKEKIQKQRMEREIDDPIGRPGMR